MNAIANVTVGDKILFYDSYLLKDLIELVVRIESSFFGDVVFTKRENGNGCDERIVKKENIKEVIINVDNTIAV
jgi:hypothetical protein